jgi:hypothetical protein
MLHLDFGHTIHSCAAQCSAPTQRYLGQRENIMRYVFIDNYTGYIYGDSADIGGRIVTGTPAEVAEAVDADIGEVGREYRMLGRNPGTTETGYDVYRVDVGGSEIVPVVRDGQNQEIIKQVVECGEYIGFVLTSSPEA